MSNVKTTNATTTAVEFNKAYSSIFHLLWTDFRIPKELKNIIAAISPKTALELGCGLGRFSSFIAQQGIAATGVDFSSVAIEKAKKRVENQVYKPEFIVGDVTNLKELDHEFDLAVDIGCFHCLNEAEQQKYAVETARLLKPDAVLLIWAMDSAPSGIELSPKYVKRIFRKGFHLEQCKSSRRRIVASHWYWLVRDECLQG